MNPFHDYVWLYILDMVHDYILVGGYRDLWEDLTCRPILHYSAFSSQSRQQTLYFHRTVVWLCRRHVDVVGHTARKHAQSAQQEVHNHAHLANLKLQLEAPHCLRSILDARCCPTRTAYHGS